MTRDTLVEADCILEGEFFIALQNKGDVATKYVDIDPLFTEPDSVARIGGFLLDSFPNEFDVLAAPAVGGIPLLFGAANELNRRVQTVWADKIDENSFMFKRRGFEAAIRGKRVLVLEDILSSGGSVGAVCKLVSAVGGRAVGVSCIWNRGGVTAEALGVPHLHSLIDEKIPSWKAEEHPMWGTWPLVTDKSIGHAEYFPRYNPRIRLLR